MKIKLNTPSFVLLEILIVLVYMNPIADLFPSFLQIVVFVLWATFCIERTDVWSRALPLTSINFIIFIISFLRCFAAGQINMDYYSTLQVVIARYQMLIYPILFVYVLTLTKEEKKRIFNLSMFSISVTILISLYYILFVDPQAIRNTQRDIALFGVGDFMLMYAMAIAVGPLLFLILECHKNGGKVLFKIITFVLIIICLLLCNLVTSVVISVISIFVMWAVTMKHKRIYLGLPLVMIVLISLRTIFAKLLYGLASKNYFYWSTNNKIIAIANVLSGDMTNIDTLSRRFMLAGWSLESFKRHPIFGINWKEHSYGVIGCHMQWADDLGRYGIIGNIVIFWNYIRMAVYSVKHVQIRFVKDAMITIWVMFIILGFLNPSLSATNLMMMFIVIPSFDGVLEMEHDYEST